jgi:hypothetical protein
MTADGNRPSLSFSATCGRSSASTKSRTIVRIMVSFSEGAKPWPHQPSWPDEPEMAVGAPVEDAHPLVIASRNTRNASGILRLHQRLSSTDIGFRRSVAADDARSMTDAAPRGWASRRRSPVLRMVFPFPRFLLRRPLTLIACFSS